MLVIINFKTYKEATGSNAVKLAKSFSKFHNVIVCAQASDISGVSKFITTFAQHVDPVDVGMNTGSITAFAVKNAGAKGTLLNHSEHRLSFEELKSCLSIARKYKLKTVICARNSDEVKKFVRLRPDFIAIEPKELIGGEVSVTQSNPNLIAKSLKAAGKIPLLCGAGVHSKEDLMTAKKLGAKGVLIASAVVKNKSPAKKLRELLK